MTMKETKFIYKDILFIEWSKLTTTQNIKTILNTMYMIDRSAYKYTRTVIFKINEVHICKIHFKVHLIFKMNFKLSKKISNDQELIQSDPTSRPQNQKGNN